MSRVLSVLGIIVLVAWGLAVPLGLGRAVLGREPMPHEIALGWLPGVLVAMGCFIAAAWPRLVSASGTWRPGTVVDGLERGPERRRKAKPAAVVACVDARGQPGSAGPSGIDAIIVPAGVAVAPTPPPLTHTAPERAIVHLGPRAEPAYAAWSLRWEAPGHGHGVVVLPFGARVLVGRAPAADVVIRLDQVSWEHLELDVRDGDVTLLDLESSNGTRSDEAPIAPRRPWRWAPKTSIQLAHPTAVTLTLEALR